MNWAWWISIVVMGAIGIAFPLAMLLAMELGRYRGKRQARSVYALLCLGNSGTVQVWDSAIRSLTAVPNEQPWHPRGLYCWFRDMNCWIQVCELAERACDRELLHPLGQELIH